MQTVKFLIFSTHARSINFPIKISRFSNFRFCNACFKNYKTWERLNLPRSSCLITSLSDSYPTFFTAQRVLSTGHDKSGKKELQEVDDDPPKKLSLYKRYKKMFKEYWYVLLPVHLVTSAIWFGSFYYTSTCGLDIVPFLEYINLPESFISPLRKSSLGHIAVASILYKLATPARYMVTVVGSTFAVNILKKRGLIRPVPTKAEIKTIIQNKLKKDGISDKDN